MTAREASTHESECAYDGAGVCCKRARAILAALVAEHEGLGELSDYEVPLSVVKVRELERGVELTS